MELEKEIKIKTTLLKRLKMIILEKMMRNLSKRRVNPAKPKYVT